MGTVEDGAGLKQGHFTDALKTMREAADAKTLEAEARKKGGRPSPLSATSHAKRKQPQAPQAALPACHTVALRTCHAWLITARSAHPRLAHVPRVA